jgi:MinD-like ATPase involved in chromosome partitioning or flagellar assembly
MLAAVFVRYGGAGVLAWDNNETRGSLAWRTQQSGHSNTVVELLPQADKLLGTGAQSAEMSYFAHHQPEDKFDVLHSDRSVDGSHEVSGDEVDAIHRVAAKYYRLIMMDSGNNERAANWRFMTEHSSQLVVPCTNVEDTAEAGARMLEALSNRDEHSRKLAQNAVAIISKRTPGKDPNMDRIVTDFRPLVREVVTIPYDKALVSGVIHFDALNSDTKRAWLRATAAVAKGL